MKIHTDHPDKGQPMTVELLKRCYIDTEFNDEGFVVKVVKVSPSLNDDKDKWKWNFAQFKARVELALKNIPEHTEW